MVDEFSQAQVPGQGGRQEQAGIGHQAMVVKEDADTVGSLFTENVFAIPVDSGLGRLLLKFQSLSRQGTTLSSRGPFYLMVSFAYVFINLLVDISYTFASIPGSGSDGTARGAGYGIRYRGADILGWWRNSPRSTLHRQEPDHERGGSL